MIACPDGAEWAEPSIHSSLMGAGETAASLAKAQVWSLLHSSLLSCLFFELPKHRQSTHFPRTLTKLNVVLASKELRGVQSTTEQHTAAYPLPLKPKSLHYSRQELLGSQFCHLSESFLGGDSQSSWQCRKGNVFFQSWFQRSEPQTQDGQMPTFPHLL